MILGTFFMNLVDIFDQRYSMRNSRTTLLCVQGYPEGKRSLCFPLIHGDPFDDCIKQSRLTV